MLWFDIWDAITGKYELVNTKEDIGVQISTAEVTRLNSKKWKQKIIDLIDGNGVLPP